MDTNTSDEVSAGTVYAGYTRNVRDSSAAASVLNCSLAVAFPALVEPLQVASVRRMSVSSVVLDTHSAVAHQQVVVAGLSVGDYFDGDVPPAIWTANITSSWSTSGARTEVSGGHGGSDRGGGSDGGGGSDRGTWHPLTIQHGAVGEDASAGVGADGAAAMRWWPNRVVASMIFTPDASRLCVSSNGDGLLCARPGF